ncbi:hypothetical protein B0H16DRAFT_1511328 [Mycena metata]|uniref:Uncharacterized protein n=1 Tax=Mycena metata TaxID=1033252 RepID=A0AAD7JWC8_9AGAR|nr:hypothetical protein B0H16DRAFT_1511328 [Mycena metata]
MWAEQTPALTIAGASLCTGLIHQRMSRRAACHKNIGSELLRVKCVTPIHEEDEVEFKSRIWLPAARRVPVLVSAASKPEGHSRRNFFRRRAQRWRVSLKVEGQFDTVRMRNDVDYHQCQVETCHTLHAARREHICDAPCAQHLGYSDVPRQSMIMNVSIPK